MTTVDQAASAMPSVRGYSEERTRQMLQQLEDFAITRVAPRAQEIDRSNERPMDLIREGAEIGFMRLHLDEHNQLDLGNMLLIHEVSERLSVYNAAIPTTFATSRLVIYLLARWASEELREKWVPLTAAARAFGSFALTEPGTGTDVRGIKTVARRDGASYVLNGDKCWVGNAPIADYAIVLSKLETDSRDADTVALVVDMSSDGASGAPGPALSGFRGLSNGTLTFRDVRVPAENALRVEGFRGMMNGLNMARLDATSYACGLLRGAIEASVERAGTREAFGKVIGDLPSIQMKIGRMATDYVAARELNLRAAESYMVRDGGDQDIISMAKMFASDAARRHTDEAMQIHAASGIPEDSAVGRLHRDSKITQIFDGTSEIHETMLGRRAVRQFTNQGQLGAPFVPTFSTRTHY